MLSIQQRRDLLDVLLAEHPDGRFSFEDAVQTAGSAAIAGGEPAPSEEEVRALLRSWQWRRVVTRAQREGFRIRHPGGSPV